MNGTKPVRLRIVYTNPVEAFSIKLKVAFLGGVVFAVPFVAWLIWRFVRPALQPHERRVVRLACMLSVFLFVVGGVFGYCFLPVGIPALMHFGMTGVEQIWPFDDYIGFCTKLVLAFGLAFQMPLLLGVLGRLGVVRSEDLKRARPYAVVLILVLAALLTPPDVLSQIALAIPLCGLYEISLIVVRHSHTDCQN